MSITRDYKQTINERINKDPAFTAALLDEAITLFLHGEPEVARLVLRDLVNATVGFEALALEVDKPSKSLHRMLSARGNPTMDNLTKIIGILRKQLGLDIEVHTIPLPSRYYPVGRKFGDPPVRHGGNHHHSGRSRLFVFHYRQGRRGGGD